MYLLRPIEDQCAFIFNPSISIFGLMILAAILKQKLLIIYNFRWKIELERENRKTDLTPSCLGLGPISAHPYMWNATFGALYPPGFLRAVIWIILLITVIGLEIVVIDNIPYYQWFNSEPCELVQNSACNFTYLPYISYRLGLGRQVPKIKETSCYFEQPYNALPVYN